MTWTAVAAGLLIWQFTTTARAQSSVDQQSLLQRQLALVASSNAVRAAIKEVSAKTKADPAISASLSEEMYAKVSEHSELEPSRIAARRFVVDKLNQQLRATINTILEKHRLTAEEIRSVFPDQDEQTAKAIDQNLRSAFDLVYDSGRRAAVAEQAKEININFRLPPQEQVEDKVENWANERPRFVAGLVKEALPAGTVLFAENRDAQQKLASKIADQIDLEYRNQRQLVEENCSENKLPANLVLASQIQAHLTGRLAAYVKQTHRQGVPSYSVFKTVNSFAARKAEGVERQRFDVHLRDYKLPLAAADLKTVMLADPGAHHTLVSSSDAFADRLLESVTAAAINQYLTHAGNVSPTAQGHLLAVAGQDGRRERLRNRLLTSLRETLPPLRKTIAEQQRDKHFPSLPQWWPTEDQLVKSRQNSNQVNIQLLSFSEAQQLLGQKRVDSPLLIEAENLIVAGVGERMTLGLTALGDQLRLVGEIDQQKGELLKKRILDGYSKESLEKEWKTELTNRWPAKSRFPIFKFTIDELNKNISKHFNTVARRPSAPQIGSNRTDTQSQDSTLLASNNQSVTAQQPISSAAQSSSAPASRSGTGQGSGAGGGGDNGGGGGKSGQGAGDDGEEGNGLSDQGSGEPDIVVLLSDIRANRCLAIIERGGRGNVEFVPSEIDSSVEKITQLIKPALEELLVKKSSKPEKDDKGQPIMHARLHLRVQSQSVSYVTGIRSRQALQEVISSWQRHPARGTVPVVLSWSDSSSRPSALR
jgi:hypothetical protein